MILNPKWLDWLSDERDENGKRNKLKANTPDDIKKEFEELLKEEKESIRNEKIKKTIF